MSTEKILQISSQSSEDTELIGEAIGRNLRGGEIIELSSDVGGGKTTFTRGLVRGAGSEDRVASPTFTVSKQYQAPNFTIDHYDFYRLHDPGIMKMEIAEAISDPSRVVVVEWPDSIRGILPERRLRIMLKYTQEDKREIVVSVPYVDDYLTHNVSIQNS